MMIGKRTVSSPTFICDVLVTWENQLSDDDARGWKQNLLA